MQWTLLRVFFLVVHFFFLFVDIHSTRQPLASQMHIQRGMQQVWFSFDRHPTRKLTTHLIPKYVSLDISYALCLFDIDRRQLPIASSHRWISCCRYHQTRMEDNKDSDCYSHHYCIQYDEIFLMCDEITRPSLRQLSEPVYTSSTDT